MRALGLALVLLAIPAAGVDRQPQQPTEAGTADAAELPVDHAEAGPEDRLGVLLTLTVPPGENVRDALCLLCSIKVQGTVERDAVAIWGGIDVEGRVGVLASGALGRPSDCPPPCTESGIFRPSALAGTIGALRCLFDEA